MNNFKEFSATFRPSTTKEGNPIVGKTKSGKEVQKYFVVNRVENEITGSVGSRLFNLWGFAGLEGKEYTFKPQDWNVQVDSYTNEETGQVYESEVLVPRT